MEELSDCLGRTVQGERKKPTVVLEAISDAELWIWAANFGSPGSLNDINVLDTSKIVEKIIDGTMLPDYSYKINGRERKLCYYNVDGIYPNWAIFVKTIVDSTVQKHKVFSGAQEAFRCGAGIWRFTITVAPFDIAMSIFGSRIYVGYDEGCYNSTQYGSGVA